MTSFEIDCPQSFYGCDKIDVYAVHQTNHSNFHLIKDGKTVSTIQRLIHGAWRHIAGKTLTVEELDFISKQIENN
ncbi:hypothetical protein [Daejeonella sp.]|uniref:hypothetical protein n=1 Tax=Daejeonella sp. TaxID=2805397 RepID=UPI0030C1330C